MKLYRADIYKPELLCRPINQSDKIYLARLALKILADLRVKPKINNKDYDRHVFDAPQKWQDEKNNPCLLRQSILRRDLAKYVLNQFGGVEAGEFTCLYSGEHITLPDREAVRYLAEIDHVVSLSNAWSTGACNLKLNSRCELAKDPIELQVVSTSSNAAKANLDASKWLPDNAAYHTQYIARQIAVKSRYHLWVTKPEHKAMYKILQEDASRKDYHSR